MRKYLRNITVGAALLLLAGSCTDKFEEYNTNQYQIHDADPATLMKSMFSRYNSSGILGFLTC